MWHWAWWGCDSSCLSKDRWGMSWSQYSNPSLPLEKKSDLKGGEVKMQVTPTESASLPLAAFKHLNTKSKESWVTKGKHHRTSLDISQLCKISLLSSNPSARKNYLAYSEMSQLSNPSYICSRYKQNILHHSSCTLAPLKQRKLQAMGTL